MSSVTGHIFRYLNSHGELLTVSQTFVPLRVSLQFGFVNAWHLFGIDRKQLVFFIPVPHVSRTPPAILLLEEETESTVGFRVNFASINREPLSYRGFHLGDRTKTIGSNIAGHSMAPMHNERTVVHASLRCGHEISIRHSTGPSRIDMSARMKDAVEVFPLACISGLRVSIWCRLCLLSLTYSKANPLLAPAALISQLPDGRDHCSEWHFLALFPLPKYGDLACLTVSLPDRCMAA